MNVLKLIISSKGNLSFKYGKDFAKINTMLVSIQKADKKKSIDTEIVFIDDAASMKTYGLKPIKSITPKECKGAVDALYNKKQPAYMMIFGAQDIIPFQDLLNPADDDDSIVPSDLPYACSAAYSKKVSAFTGPNRVVGRLPDVPGKADVKYVQSLVKDIVNHKAEPVEGFQKYFSVTAQVWTKSTQLSLRNMFGNADKLLISPPVGKSYKADQLKAKTHFFNCHGALNDANYFGQKGDDYPVAFHSSYINGKLTYPTVVAAECCYGAQLLNPDNEPNTLSIASNYLLNHAVSFVGSSTVAYGPADGQAQADLITQYFIKNVFNGASAGRAFLEARQQFLADSGPHLDPYELKTIAQFYLLGDPSIQPVKVEEMQDSSSGNTVENRRMGLFNKGVMLNKISAPSEPAKTNRKSKHEKELKKILKDTSFNTHTSEKLYDVNSKSSSGLGAKGFDQDITFRAFTKKMQAQHWEDVQVLVVKESKAQVLGWRVYNRK